MVYDLVADHGIQQKSHGKAQATDEPPSTADWYPAGGHFAIEGLPLDVLHRVLSKLSFRSLLQASAVGRAFHRPLKLSVSWMTSWITSRCASCYRPARILGKPVNPFLDQQ